MKKRVQALWSNEFFQGGIFFTGSSMIINVLNYAFTILAGRSLGPAGYGEITALFSYMTITSVPVLVLSAIIVQRISAVHTDKYIYTFSLEHFFLENIKRWWFIFIPAILFIPWIPAFTNLSLLSSLVLIPLVILTFISSFYAAALQGLKLFIFISVISLIAAIIKLTGAVIAYEGIGGMGSVILFLGLSLAVTYIASWYYIHHRMPPKTEGNNKKIQKKIIHIITSPQFLIATGSLLAITLLNNADIIIVKKYFSAYDAGIYASWSLFAKIIFYFVGPITTITFVLFAGGGSKKEQDRAFIIYICILAAIGSGSYVFYTYFAPWVIGGFFGHAFNDVIPYLGSASIFGSFYALIYFINSYFLAKSHRAALILLVGMPVYIVSLIVSNHTISSIIWIDMIFAGILTTLYSVSYIIVRKN